jgi:small subunit ribosomal protein S7
MPRRREVPKRDILPDPKFGSVDLSKFVNVLMDSGKKSVAERIIYGAFRKSRPRAARIRWRFFHLAVNNVKPLVEVKSRRVGGANYQVPVEVRPSRRMALSMRWLREAARKRSEKSMGQRLGRRTAGGVRRAWCGDEKARRSSPHGGSQQGVLAFPFLSSSASRRVSGEAFVFVRRPVASHNEASWRFGLDKAGKSSGPQDSHRALSQYRHFGAHRRRQDHHHRAHPVLHRRQSQDWRGP